MVSAKRPGTIPYGIIYGVIALTALMAARYLPVLDVLPSCPLRMATGLPCPTCGATRTLVSAARGDLAGAIAFNPLVAASLIAALMVLVLSTILAFFNKGVSISTSRAEGTALRAAAALLFLSNWIYLSFYL